MYNDTLMQYKTRDADVIRAWVNKEVSRYGEVSWQASSIKSYDEYQLHSNYFWNPLAVRLVDGDQEMILVNGEQAEQRGMMGNHGADMQRALINMIPDHQRVIVPFDILDAAGISPLRLEPNSFIDFSDGGFWVVRDRRDGKYYHTQEEAGHRHHISVHPVDRLVDTRQGNFTEHGEGSYTRLSESVDAERFVLGYWHRMGGVLLTWQGRHYLVATDEGRYFMSELPRTVGSVEEAFESLKPQIVKDAIENNLEVQRQGEWFFIPTDLDEGDVMRRLGYQYVTHLRNATYQRPLPKSFDSDNDHFVRLAHLPDGGLPETILATGMVYHRNEWGDGTNEHQSLDLSGAWFIAVPNTSPQSWSIGGRVD